MYCLYSSIEPVNFKTVRHLSVFLTLHPFFSVLSCVLSLSCGTCTVTAIFPLCAINSTELSVYCIILYIFLNYFNVALKLLCLLGDLTVGIHQESFFLLFAYVRKFFFDHKPARVWACSMCVGVLFNWSIIVSNTQLCCRPMNDARQLMEERREIKFKEKGGDEKEWDKRTYMEARGVGGPWIIW